MAGLSHSRDRCVDLSPSESDMRDELDTPTEPHSFGDLPIQPTGSGVQIWKSPMSRCA
jgi:hypothetical protein